MALCDSATGPRSDQFFDFVSRQANPQASRPVYFVPHLHEADFVLAAAQRFHYAVDTITWKTENNFDTPSSKECRP
jgi:hypothetical protein